MNKIIEEYFDTCYYIGYELDLFFTVNQQILLYNASIEYDDKFREDYYSGLYYFSEDKYCNLYFPKYITKKSWLKAFTRYYFPNLNNNIITYGQQNCLQKKLMNYASKYRYKSIKEKQIIMTQFNEMTPIT
jgi:hypothetical protein